MPEMHFTVRWPDASTTRCYSPSLVIRDFFEVGRHYPLDRFRALSREALTIASERVRQKYGMGCAHAERQLLEIEQIAARFVGQPDAGVTVEAFDP
ncbi:MAG: MSMEG_0570 family nitrogen starvation response protein [Burkholderiales bacterium]|nr:MSMEG_0570 family nitrogen starvation response protein [Burkholderiales bacterium]